MLFPIPRSPSHYGNPLLHLLRTTRRIGLLITNTTLKLLSKLLPTVIRNFMTRICRSSSRLWSEIFLAVVSRPLNGYQEVNIYDHQIQSCHRTAKGELYSDDTSELLRINSFKKEVNLRLHNNSVSLMEVRLQWKNLGMRKGNQTVFSQPESFTCGIKNTVRLQWREPHVAHSWQTINSMPKHGDQSSPRTSYLKNTSPTNCWISFPFP